MTVLSTILKVILIPLKIALALLGYALIAILFFLGFIIKFLSHTCGLLIYIVGVLVGLGALISSIYIIKGIRNDTYTLWNGVGMMTVEWLITMFLCAVPACVENIYDGVIGLCENISDSCIGMFRR